MAKDKVRMGVRLNSLAGAIVIWDCSLSKENRLDFQNLIQAKLGDLYPEQAGLLRRYYIEGEVILPYERIKLMGARQALIGALNDDDISQIEGLV